MEIGFIGTGTMGKPMTLNLVKAGYVVSIFDADKEKIKKLATMGATPCENPKNVINKSEVVLLSLPNPKIVEDVVMGKEGICSADIKGKTIIDLSTVTPQSAIKMFSIVKERGASWLEVPVSGGETNAKSGKLTMIVGGDKEVFEKNLPILKVLGEQISFIGEVGSASTIKLLNQLLFGINLVGITEAFALAKKMGVDFDKLYEVISNGSGGSYALDTRYNNFIKKDKYDPGFSVNLLLKDLNLIKETAESCNIPLQMGNFACDSYQMCKNSGYGDKDVIALLLAANKIANKSNNSYK
ncbi:MAG: NAD(P)-dependent oxidoreductase [Eubacteriaceae bacterium]